MSSANCSRGRGARLLANTAVFSVGKLLSKLLVFFMTRLYTACLSPAEYSTADLIVNAANLIIPLACVGISEGIFRNAADRSADKEAYLPTDFWFWVWDLLRSSHSRPSSGLFPC